MSAHTQGPWRWELNEKSKWVELFGRGGLIVMDFRRWGMNGASPRFRDGSDRDLLAPAQAFGSVVAGREHHAAWFKRLNHPDANLIAAAPDLLDAAERLVEHFSDGLPDHLVEEFNVAIAKARGGQ